MSAIADARRIHSSRPVVDGHNDLPWALREAGYADLNGIDLLTHQAELHTDLPRLTEGGVGVQFWSVWVPASDPTPLRTTLEQIDLVHRMAARYPGHMKVVGTAAEAMSVADSGLVAGLLGAEGGHAIESSLGALRSLYRLGVRYLTLTHTRTIDWADSATDEARHGGLTAFGRDVVQEMNRLGMAVDLSHCSADTMRDALDTSSAPVMASHSSALSIAPHPRNVPDDVLSRIAEGGGVVMVCFYPPFVVPETARQALELLARERKMRSAGVDEDEIGEFHDRRWREHPPNLGSVRDVADHIEYIANLAGIDHVGIGSDFDGMSLTPEGLEDVSCYPNLTAELLERGWEEPDIRKVLGGNALRTLSAIEAAAQRTQR